jgi:hypothetical protein
MEEGTHTSARRERQIIDRPRLRQRLDGDRRTMRSGDVRPRMTTGTT